MSPFVHGGEIIWRVSRLNVGRIVQKVPVYVKRLELCPPVECGINIGDELNVHIVEAAGLNDGSAPQLYGGLNDAVSFYYIYRIGEGVVFI